VELAVHAGSLLTILAVTWLLACISLPILFPRWHPAAYWLVGLWIALADSLAGLLHELGHAAVAVALERRVYCITLYGFAAAARRSASSGAQEQVLIALAGPLSHLVLAGLFWSVWQALPPDDLPLRAATGLPAATNLVVGGLNLLPLRPLDGGRAVRALAIALVRGTR
jgi:Zn-dependent protease